MADNEKAKSLYDDIAHCSPFAKLQRIASQLSELIHCHKHRKVGDEYVLSMLCAMRNAIWDSEDSDKIHWHTGTPQEEGWYLLKVKSDDEIIYDTNRLIQCLWGLDWKYVHEEILAWQKINEEGEE